MKERIIKDIRYFESKPDNYQGKYDGIIGNIYQNTIDTKFIGQRISRKLNELNFISGEFDHIYINISGTLLENEICKSDKFFDKRISVFDFGLSVGNFNNLQNFDKDFIIKEMTFKVLNYIYKIDSLKLKQISNVKSLIEKYDKSLKINFLTKEDIKYKIDLEFQIRPKDEISKLIISYRNKITNNSEHKIIDISDYEDLYHLIDKISVKDGIVIFHPKKNYHAELVLKKYKNFLFNFDFKNISNEK